MLQFVRDHALLFVLAWPIVAFLVAVVVGKVLKHNERAYPYDWEAAERAGVDATSSWDSPGSLSAPQWDVDPGDGFQGSEAHNSGHGAHYDRWGS